MKATGKVILFSGILLMLLLAGCWNDLHRLDGVADGNVNITIGTVQSARTLRPDDVTVSAFERFQLTFTSGNNTETLTLGKGQASGNITLLAGTWNINTLGYIKIGDKEYEAARGTNTVTVTASAVSNVTIALQTGVFDEAPGVFGYTIGFPSGLTLSEATLSISPFTLATAANPSGGQSVSLLNSAQRNGTLELAPGYYLLTIVAKTNGDLGEKGAAFSELVHIYSGHQTSMSHTFVAADFIDPEQVVSSNSSSTAFTGLLANTTYEIVNFPLEFRDNVIKVDGANAGWAVLRYPLTEYKDKEITLTFSADVKRVGAAGTLNWQVNNNPGYPSVHSISNAAAGTWHTMGGTLTTTPTDDNPALYLNRDSTATTYYVDNFTISISGVVDNVTVTFNANSGTPTPAAIQVVRGESMGNQYPANPTRTNYTFNGWYNGSTQYTATTPITESLTLTAQWVAAGTSVSTWKGLSIPSGTTALQYTSLNGKSDVLHITPATAGSDYPWSVLEYNLSAYAGKEVTIDLAVNAWLEASSKIAWQVRPEYTVIAGSTTSAFTSTGEWLSITGSTKLTIPANGVLYLSGGGSGGQLEANHSAIYFADFVMTITETAVEQVTVTFNTNGGSTAPSPVTINKGTSLGTQFPANPTRSGYTFSGWYNSGTQYTSTTVINASLTLTAQWTSSANDDPTGTALAVGGSWKGLTISTGVTARTYTAKNGKNDVLHITPGTNWSALTYSLDAYAGKEVIISVSVDAWVESAVDILWQVNQTGYPTIAAGSPDPGQWVTISGSNTVTPASGNVLYLSGGDSLNGKSIYLSGFTVSIQEANPTKTQVTSSWNGLTVPSLTTAYQYSTQHGKTDVLEVIPGTNWAALTRSLASYAGSEVTISMSMDVWLQSASKIAWQANSTGHPIIAGSTTTDLSAGEWHTVTGSTKVTPTATTELYLSYEQLGNTTIYLANFSVSISGGSWVDPLTQNTQLTGGQTIAMTWYSNRGSHGEGQALGTLPGMSSSSNEPYHYEIWLEGAAASENRAGVNDVKFTWYGADKGGGSAFRAEWTKNPSDYLARIGYFWGGNNGPNFNTLKNVYMDFNYTRAASHNGSNNPAGNYSYIGVYGWARNPNASVVSERLIEFYIVEDWFGNQWNTSGQVVGQDTIMSGKSGTVYYAPSAGSMANVTYQNTGQTFSVNGANYIVYKATRTGPSIDGDTTFTQIFSVRQTMRQAGTISVNDHVNRWKQLTGLDFVNMYDLKFLVESGGGEGWVDFRWLKITQEDNAR